MSRPFRLAVRRNGVITIRRSADKHAIELVEVDDAYQAERLRRLVWGSARRSRTRNQWLVPGIPEAIDDDAAFDALVTYGRRLVARLEGDLRPGAWRALGMLAEART